MSATMSLMRRIDHTGVPLLAARLVVGGLFLWMGFKKVLEPIDFLKLVRLYGMVPEEPAAFLNLIAVILPWLEVVTGVALILGVFLRGAGLLIAAMLAVFTPVIFLRALQMMSAEGIPFTQVAFDCGCGSGEVVIWKKLLSNTGLFLLSLIPVWSESRFLCLARLLARGGDEVPSRIRGSALDAAPPKFNRSSRESRDRASVS